MGFNSGFKGLIRILVLGGVCMVDKERLIQRSYLSICLSVT